MSLPETQKVIHGNEHGEPVIMEIPLPKPSQNQVLVKIEFSPLNPTDIIRLKGHYGDKKLIGAEGSGVVVAVGENLKYPFKVGDRVHVRGPGTYAQYVVTTSENISHTLQDDLSLEEAASHFVNPCTVHYMGYLAEKGGHKAAIHTAGSSALGRMLIRYFKLKGIKLINIVRREEYVEELKKEGADYVLNSQSPDFEKELKEIAEKKNATIAFDAIGGEFTNKVFKSQPPNSILYIYGALGGLTIQQLDIPQFFQKKVIAGLFLTDYLEILGEQGCRELFRETHSLLPTTLHTKVIKVYPLEQIKDALAFYQGNSSKGKILLKPN